MNTYFQFNQFTIQQDQCAMKVCTDACVFGAYISNYLTRKKTSSILDIGTGTGLLPLMIAQKNKTPIDTVEINNAAYQQAKENIAASPWSKQITIYHNDILHYDTENKYDFIISNPPFFEGDLTSVYKNKNVAKHNETLSLVQLTGIMNRLLTPSGEFAVMIPYRRVNEFEEYATAGGFYLKEKLNLKQTNHHPYFRGLLIFSLKNENKIEKEMTIKLENQVYTTEFIELLKDYYLYL